MKTPLVTVLTTTYNHSKFIADCIKSVLAQTYDNWEQVIVDDGSTDNTGEIVKEFEDERIVYVARALDRSVNRRWTAVFFRQTSELLFPRAR